MSQTLSLYRLQQTDAAIERILARLEEIETILSDDAAIRAARIQVEEREQQRRNAERQLRQAEQAVEAQRIKIEQVEASLYGGAVRNPKELQDLHNDLAALQRHLSKLENQQLEAMIALESAETVSREAQQALQVTQAERERLLTTLREEQARLQKELEKYRAERQAITVSISAENLELYQQLRQSRRGVAVASIVESACSACGAALPPAIQQAARSSAQLTRCPSCGRILCGY